MKINSTVALSLLLLVLMAVAGYVSSVWGFTIGSQALESVTQPDTRPPNKAKTPSGGSQQRAVVMLKEQDILTNVRARIEGKGKNAKPEKPQSQKNDTQSSAKPKAQLVVAASQPGFPLVNRDRGVMLEVISAQYSGGTLQLRLNLKNESDRTVRFLYSFMDVTDNHGRALIANAEGLPEKLPPDGKPISGILSIPSTALDDVEKLSLRLTDYPEQKLKLQVSEIPVKI
ncbi:hypothetical protein [Gloeocapsopsis dulcis]|uniref:Uncharacterized protein n=1 Tax=Gloeocapsopsis dulcis AAB1 = 1H9 TaxID=1433147 RepID=A0A6N8FVG6_9CHRO|nr:hypothetical protein [Gloeocapsopsis dulcis]MUL37063.1 hypothetical protein [Gloeocapsopsis dulcis AAB1 = 1H9]WNN87917.1 hypothetical protein P0S91_16575 [Gloeocapsopsis dulcis]